MAKYTVSPLAAQDIKDIFKYTIVTFGRTQAVHYREGLKAFCVTLTRHPQMGTIAEDLHFSLRSFDYRSHRIYYVSTDTGILIVRILHQNQDPMRHL